MPSMLSPIWKVVQEGMGFRPNDLKSGHKMQGLLVWLKDNCHDAEPPQNLLDYTLTVSVTGCTRQWRQLIASLLLHEAKLYDWHVVHHVVFFCPGDQVFGLVSNIDIPILGKHFQASTLW